MHVCTQTLCSKQCTHAKHSQASEIYVAAVDLVGDFLKAAGQARHDLRAKLWRASWMAWGPTLPLLLIYKPSTQLTMSQPCPIAQMAHLKKVDFLIGIRRRGLAVGGHSVTGLQAFSQAYFQDLASGAHLCNNDLVA